MKEEVEKRLRQAQLNLTKYDPGMLSHTRLLGCMELALVLLGKIEGDGQLPYKTQSVNVGWLYTRMVDRPESYSTMIQRECIEYLTPNK